MSAESTRQRTGTSANDSPPTITCVTPAKIWWYIWRRVHLRTKQRGRAVGRDRVQLHFPDRAIARGFWYSRLR